MEAINKYVSSLQDKSARMEKQIEEFKKRISEFGQPHLTVQMSSTLIPGQNKYSSTERPNARRSRTKSTHKV